MPLDGVLHRLGAVAYPAEVPRRAEVVARFASRLARFANDRALPIAYVGCTQEDHGNEREGTTRLHRLEENLGASTVRITADDLREIDGTAAQLTVHGARYPESAQRMIDR